MPRCSQTSNVPGLAAPCHAGWVLASESRPSQPGTLYATCVPESASIGSGSPASGWCWSLVPVPGLGEAPPQVQAALDDVAVEVLQLEARGSGPGSGAFEAVVLYR